MPIESQASHPANALPECPVTKLDFQRTFSGQI